MENDMRKLIDQVKNFGKSPINEVFGFSKKEKEEKYLKEKIEQAKKEIDNYNFNRLFKQTNKKDENTKLKQLVDIILKDAKYSLQTLNFLMPHLFIREEDNTGAMAAILNYQQTKLSGIIPTNFWFLISSNNEIFDEEKSKERMKFELDDFLKHKNK